MPFVVLLDGAGAGMERFRKGEIGCPIESGMSGKHDRDTGKKFRVTKLTPEPGVWREVRAELDKGVFRISIRGHRFEPGFPVLQSGRGRQ